MLVVKSKLFKKKPCLTYYYDIRIAFKHEGFLQLSMFSHRDGGVMRRDNQMIRH